MEEFDAEPGFGRWMERLTEAALPQYRPWR